MDDLNKLRIENDGLILALVRMANDVRELQRREAESARTLKAWQVELESLRAERKAWLAAEPQQGATRP